jgi:hypothetical protein
MSDIGDWLDSIDPLIDRFQAIERRRKEPEAAVAVHGADVALNNGAIEAEYDQLNAEWDAHFENMPEELRKGS